MNLFLVESPLQLLGTTATGIYAVGFEIGRIISIFVSAFNKAWSPWRV